MKFTLCPTSNRLNLTEDYDQYYSEYGITTGQLRKVEILMDAIGSEDVYFARKELVDANSEVYLVETNTVTKVATFT